MDFSYLRPGAVLLARDGRHFVFVCFRDDGYMLLKYGPGPDEFSWFGPDGAADPDDPDFVSDADVVSVISIPLFDESSFG